MIMKVDRIIAAVRSTVPPETIHTAQAERRGRNQPSRWRKRAGAGSTQTMILSTPTTSTNQRNDRSGDQSSRSCRGLG